MAHIRLQKSESFSHRFELLGFTAIADQFIEILLRAGKKDEIVRHLVDFVIGELCERAKRAGLVPAELSQPFANLA